MESIARMASLAIGAPTSPVQSPNSSCRPAMMRTSIPRPSPICEEFFFRTFAAAELATANSTQLHSKPFGQLDDVLSLATHIVEAIEHVANKVNAEPAGLRSSPDGLGDGGE